VSSIAVADTVLFLMLLSMRAPVKSSKVLLIVLVELICSWPTCPNGV
jgi:hypothetical protein